MSIFTITFIGLLIILSFVAAVPQPREKKDPATTSSFYSPTDIDEHYNNDNVDDDQGDSDHDDSYYHYNRDEEYDSDGFETYAQDPDYDWDNLYEDLDKRYGRDL